MNVCWQIQEEDESSNDSKYDVDKFVQDAVSLKITPFMLDTYANEYDELVRTRDAHSREMDTLRNSNRTLTNQVYVIELGLSKSINIGLS